jgi:hypothetical protein
VARAQTISPEAYEEATAEIDREVEEGSQR